MDHLATRNVWFGRLTSLQRLLLLGTCLCTDRASDRSAAAATLQELLDGGSIIVGNARFSDWEVDSLTSTAENPHLAEITVVPLLNDLANPGLLFAANGQLTVSGVNAIDLMFTYRVQALSAGNAFTNHALALTGVNFGGNGGLAFVSDDLRDDSGGDLEPTLVIDDKASNFAQRRDMSEFAPQAELSVTSNVFISGLSATDMINLTSFTQRFAQTGPVFAAGDFDEDGDVDAADLAKWKAGYGATGDATHLQGDADGDRDVDGADLLIWQRELGGGGPSVSTSASVPEPVSPPLFLLAVISLSLRRQLGPLGSANRLTA